MTILLQNPLSCELAAGPWLLRLLFIWVLLLSWAAFLAWFSANGPRRASKKGVLRASDIIPISIWCTLLEEGCGKSRSKKQTG